MGMCVSLCSISPVAYDAVVNEMETNEHYSTVNEFALEKNWWWLHRAFDRMGEPLACAIRGEYRTFDGIEEGEDAHEGYVSPSTAKEIATRLESLTFEELGYGLDSDDVAELRRCFKTLQEAYSTAASNGLAIRIVGI